MNKVYIALQENYHMLATETGACVILGIYKTIDKALDRILDNIAIDTLEYGYVIDNECDLEQFKKDKKDYVRLFYKEQENWDYHCEYKIVESEVEDYE